MRKLVVSTHLVRVHGTVGGVEVVGGEVVGPGNRILENKKQLRRRKIVLGLSFFRKYLKKRQ